MELTRSVVVFIVKCVTLFNCLFFSAKKYVPPGGSGSELCQTKESGAEQCPDGESGDSSKDFGSMGIIFLGIFITGFANSLFYAFGKSFANVNLPPWYVDATSASSSLLRYCRNALH